MFADLSNFLSYITLLYYKKHEPHTNKEYKYFQILCIYLKKTILKNLMVWYNDRNDQGKLYPLVRL